MTLVQRPLAGCVINLSISESNQSGPRGFPSWQVNRITLQLATAFVGQGAGLLFGHDWRDDGIMQAVHSFARQAQSPITLSDGQDQRGRQPVIQNLLPWPDLPRLPEWELEQVSSTVHVMPAGLPEDLLAVDEEARRAGPDSDLYRYVRARGLTFLRHQLTEACHVRFCLGGRLSRFEGLYPGTIEEALLAIRAGKPLYLASLLGGATEQVVQAIEGKDMPDSFCPSTTLEDFYRRPLSRRPDPLERVMDGMDVWKEFVRTGREKLAAANYLSVRENEELFHTAVVERMIQLVLTGLSRLWSDRGRRV